MMKAAQNDRRTSTPVRIFGVVAIGLLALTLITPKVTSRTATRHPESRQPPRSGSIAAPILSLPRFFERNQGQTDARVRFFSRMTGYTMFLTRDGAVFALEQRPAPELPLRNSVGRRSTIGDSQTSSKSASVWINFIGSNPDATVDGLEPLPGKINYLIGNDPHRWHTKVPIYGAVRYRAIYPGIDLVYHGGENSAEYDMIVAPGARTSSIRLALRGADQINLDRNGDIAMSTALGAITMRKPVIYQEAADGTRAPIAGHYAMREGSDGVTTASIVVANYDRGRRLVIDPQIVYSSYLGGGGENGGSVQSFPALQAMSSELPAGAIPAVADAALDVAVGANNIAYIAGLAYSTTFPTTPGVIQTVNHGAGNKTPNAFIAAFDTTKSGNASLVFSTLLGGSGVSNNNGKDGDQATGIAIDGSGNAYVSGVTYSNDFPVNSTKTPLQSNFNGNQATPTNNGFAVELSPNGSQLIYSTYINGSKGAPASRIALVPGCNSNCRMYVSGSTTTTNSGGQDFLTTSNAFQSANPDTVGNSAAYLTVIDPTQGTSGLVYSSFLGGAGKTLSSGSGGDGATGIAVDSNGLVYLTGFTYSAGVSGGFPVTSSAYQSVNNADTNKQTNAFVSVFDITQNTGAATLKYSTYLGGSGDPNLIPGAASDIGTDLVLDPNTAGTVWLTGLTFSSAGNAPGFPTTPNAYQTDNNSDANGLNSHLSNAFITELNTTLSGTSGPTPLLYSTYLGGSGLTIGNPFTGKTIGAGDAGSGIRVDSSENIYVAGGTASTDFPAGTGTVAACQSSRRGFGNAFLSILNTSNAQPNQLVFSTYFGGSTVDIAAAIALDGANHPYIAGVASSSDLPVTTSAFQGSNKASSGAGGKTNAFIAEFDPASSDCSLGSATATATPTSSASASSSATHTPMATATPTSSATQTATSTPIATATATQTITATATSTPTPIPTVAVPLRITAPGLSNGMISFGKVKVGRSARKVFTLSNPNKTHTPITFQSGLARTSPPGEFGFFPKSFPTNCPQMLPAKGHCTVTVFFVPNTKANNPQTATLQFFDNANNPAQQVFTLTGVGK